LAGFPGAKQRALVDLVLGLRKDANHRVAPVRIGTERVGHDDCLRLGGELGELVQIDTLSEQDGIEVDSAIGITTVSSTVSFVEKLSEELIVGVGLVGMARGTESKTFLDGGRQEGGIVLGRMPRG
jgi:hypothetical protein